MKDFIVEGKNKKGVSDEKEFNQLCARIEKSYEDTIASMIEIRDELKSLQNLLKKD